MTRPEGAVLPKLTVAGSSEPAGSSSGLRAAVADGTVSMAIGGAAAGGFGVEAAKSFMAGEVAGRWWFVAAALVGATIVVLGFWQRARARRQVRVGIVVTAKDARRGLARAQQLDQQAERFCQDTCALTLKVGVDLPDDGAWGSELVTGLADETLTAMSIAARLTPSAARVNLVPTMPLHVAFWFGARLGYTHAREVMVHSIRQADGTPAYFPAISLRAGESRNEPFTVDRLEVIDGGDPKSAALALDLQGRGDQFFDAVVAACREHGIGYLLRIRSRSARLAEDSATFTGAVEQACCAWREAALPSGARAGRHAVFLSGPAAISVALGARLASPEQGLWTAYTYDSTSSTYEALPRRAAP